MSIEEKQRALEFTFVPDDIQGDLRYDIVYDESSSPFPLRVIAGGGGGHDYPIELFIEVVEFLTSKGVIKPKAYTKTVVASTDSTINYANGINSTTAIQRPATQNSIPMPQVVKGDDFPYGSTLTANTDPLASFDIDSDSPKIPIPSVVKKEAPVAKVIEGNVPPIPQIVKSGKKDTVAPVLESSSAVTPSVEPIKKSSEIINRPVIRSRVSGDDPQSAEKEAAALRAAASKGSGKTIRKAHRTEE